MELKLERPLVVFDLETTGLDVENDRIVEVGFVKLHPDGTREEYCERVDPGIDIPEGAAKVHGIHTEDVRGLFGKPRLDKFGDAMLEFLGDCDLGGFNSIAFDYELWKAECARHGIGFEERGRHHVDAKVVFNVKETAWDRFTMGPRNLSNAARFYLGRDMDGAFKEGAGYEMKAGHGASYDASVTVDVLLKQIERYDDLPRDVPGLHRWCEDALARTAST